MGKQTKNRATEYASVGFELKAFDPQAGTIEGYASTWDLDEGGDIIVKGAFAKTIKERVPASKVKLLDSHHWDASHTIGTVTEAKEDDTGLYIKATFASTDDAQAIRTKVQEGHLDRFSIGYAVFKDRYERVGDRVVRYIDELALYEVSVVPLPMNENAAVTGVKTVVPYQDLPLADHSRKWDTKAAEGRVRSWADAEDGPNAKYREAFLWYDGDNADKFGAYKLQIADVVDGKLTAVPRGIFAAAAAIQGARGGVDIPESDVPGVKRNIERYYSRLEQTAPWNQDGAVSYLLSLAAALDDDERKTLVESLAQPAGPGDPPTGEGKSKHAAEPLRRALTARMKLLSTDISLRSVS